MTDRCRSRTANDTMDREPTQLGKMIVVVIGGWPRPTVRRLRVTDGNWQNRQTSGRPRNIQAPDAYAEYKEEGKEPSGRRGAERQSWIQCCTANVEGLFEKERDGEELWCVSLSYYGTDLFSDDQGEQRNRNASRLWSGYLFLRYLPQIMLLQTVRDYKHKRPS